MVVDDWQFSLLGLLQKMIGLLERDSLRGRDQVSHRRHDLPQHGLVRVGLALKEVNVTGRDDSGQFAFFKE